MSLVVVQRGHVPRRTGATGAPGEQQFAIDTAAKLAPMLRAMGHTVRVIDADVSLSEYRGDLFVAIHYDSGSSSASGASVGYQSAEGRRFAEAWKRAYVAAGWSRGFRDDNYTPNLGGYYGVRNAIGQGNRAAIITESGFHSNAGDKALMSPARTARSIAAAVGECTGTTPTEEDDMSAEDVKNIRADIQSLRALVSGPNLTYTVDGEQRTGSLRTITAYTRQDVRTILRLLQRMAEGQNPEALAAEIAEQINRLDAADVVDELSERLTEGTTS